MSIEELLTEDGVDRELLSRNVARAVREEDIDDIETGVSRRALLVEAEGTVRRAAREQIKDSRKEVLDRLDQAYSSIASSWSDVEPHGSDPSAKLYHAFGPDASKPFAEEYRGLRSQIERELTVPGVMENLFSAYDPSQPSTQPQAEVVSNLSQKAREGRLNYDDIDVPVIRRAIAEEIPRDQYVRMNRSMAGSQLENREKDAVNLMEQMTGEEVLGLRETYDSELQSFIGFLDDELYRVMPVDSADVIYQ